MPVRHRKEQNLPYISGDRKRRSRFWRQCSDLVAEVPDKEPQPRSPHGSLTSRKKKVALGRTANHGSHGLPGWPRSFVALLPSSLSLAPCLQKLIDKLFPIEISKVL